MALMKSHECLRRVLKLSQVSIGIAIPQFRVSDYLKTPFEQIHETGEFSFG